MDEDGQAELANELDIVDGQIKAIENPDQGRML